MRRPRGTGWGGTFKGHGLAAERGAGSLVIPGEVRGRETAERVRAGLPYRSLHEVASAWGLNPHAVAEILRIPERTLARRRQSGRLRTDESDRLARLARVAALAESVFGDREKASRWLQAGNPALGGEAPLDRLDTDPGSREVEAVLQRIAHGILD